MPGGQRLYHYPHRSAMPGDERLWEEHPIGKNPIDPIKNTNEHLNEGKIRILTSRQDALLITKILRAGMTADGRLVGVQPPARLEPIDERDELAALRCSAGLIIME